MSGKRGWLHVDTTTYFNGSCKSPGRCGDKQPDGMWESLGRARPWARPIYAYSRWMQLALPTKTKTIATSARIHETDVSVRVILWCDDTTLVRCTTTVHNCCKPIHHAGPWRTFSSFFVRLKKKRRDICVTSSLMIMGSFVLCAVISDLTVGIFFFKRKLVFALVLIKLSATQ